MKTKQKIIIFSGFLLATLLILCNTLLLSHLLNSSSEVTNNGLCVEYSSLNRVDQRITTQGLEIKLSTGWINQDLITESCSFISS